ncbi:MAG: hypothetical protein R2815_12930 [Flavobacteriales bacterium]
MGTNAGSPNVSFRFTGPQLLEQTFQDGAVLGPAELLAIRRQRLDLSEGRLLAILSYIPRSVQFDISATSVDHFRTEGASDPIIALAVVADDDRMEVTSKVYFTFHQQGFPVRVFSEEAPARSWLTEQINAFNRKADAGVVDRAHAGEVE